MTETYTADWHDWPDGMFHGPTFSWHNLLWKSGSVLLCIQQHSTKIMDRSTDKMWYKIMGPYEKVL